MRIISGEFGGRRFSPPKGLSARPTTDRAKEGLFNYLQHRLPFEGMYFLDLYAGTGNISFELISRGASGIAVERDRKAVEFIRKTVNDLGTDKLKVIQADVNRFLARGNEKFDLVFADPPYAIDDPMQLINTLLDGGMLNPGGYLILEHFKNVETAHPLRIEQRSYGQSTFSVFVQPEENAPNR